MKFTVSITEPLVAKSRVRRALAAANAPSQRRETWRQAAWRWHFYAGMIVGPILFVIAGTGALYIFKDEIERAVYPELLNVTPTAAQRSFDAAVNAANASIGLKA